MKILLGNENHLDEIYQSVDTKFAFISTNATGNVQCHPFAKCRDFLHDIIRCNLNNKSISLYSLKYDTKTFPRIYKRSLRLAVKNDSIKPEELEIKFKCGLKLIHHYEKIAGLKRLSKMERTENKENAIWLFTGSAFWLKAPYLISMYTFLLRLGDKKIDFTDDSDLQKQFSKVSLGKNDNDSKYLRQCKNNMYLVTKYAKKLFFSKQHAWYHKYYEDISTSTFHNRGGILSLCTYDTFDKELNIRFEKLAKKELTNKNIN